MSHPTDAELRDLTEIAVELGETFAARGYRIDRALEADHAFGSGQTVSSLSRDLAVDAIGVACGKTGADFRFVNGNGRELRFLSDVDRRYRVRRGRRIANGALEVTVNAESSLAIEDAGMFTAEPWAFVYVVDDGHQVLEVVAAEITGCTTGSPGRLIFGEQIQLVAGETPPRGRFIPSQDDLFLDDEGEDEEGEGLGSAGS